MPGQMLTVSRPLAAYGRLRQRRNGSFGYRKFDGEGFNSLIQAALQRIDDILRFSRGLEFHLGLEHLHFRL